MSKPQNNDTLELDDILSQPVKDKERFAAFMMRKLAENKPAQNDNLFGNFKLDFDLDFEVPLIKKSQPKAKFKAAEIQPLGEKVSATNTNTATEKFNEPPVDQASNENAPPRRSPTLSPNHRRSLRRSGNVPGSDKLRRHAIRRRSRSCGRQLLPEFEEAVNLTRSMSSPVNFLPEISSTPCAEKPKEDVKKTLKNITKEESVKPAEKPKKLSEKAEPENPLQKSPARNSILATEIEQICREGQNSFYKNVLQLDYSGRAPYSCPTSPSSPSSAGLRRTYTMEKGPAPGQLLLSPSHSFNTPSKQPVVKVKRFNHEIMVPDTPQRPSHEPAWQSQPQLEFVVPETQPQDLGELVQTLSRNASSPIVVINTSNSNRSVRRDSTPMKSIPTSPVAATSSPPIASSGRSAAVSPQKSIPQPPRVEENMDAIMTDDESDEQPSTVPLNLAPSGGNTTRQRRLRSNNRARVTIESQESSMRLLNLHQSVNAKKSKPRKTAIPLNKAPSAPINGEQFAYELTRMSNYEILDLRKRNSLNEIYPLNGHRNRRSEKLILEEEIQRELLRRNLMDEAEGLPIQPSSDDSDGEYLPVPRKTRSLQTKSSDRSQGRGRPRCKRRDIPMTTELINYLGLSQTLKSQRKSSRDGKRSLYTKGDSDSSSSPVKLPRLSRSIQIVPPPPASLRYSQNLRCSGKFDFDNVVMAAPPDFHDSLNRDTIDIAPPPPEYVINTRDGSTNGPNSNKNYLDSPPLECEGGQEQDEHDKRPSRSRSRAKPQSTPKGRKAMENELLPPPIEYVEKEDRIDERPRTSNKNSNPVDVNTNDTVEHCEPPETPEYDDSDHDQPKILRRSGKKIKHSKQKVQKSNKEPIVAPTCDEEYGKGYKSNESQNKNETRRKSDKDNMVSHTLECIEENHTDCNLSSNKQNSNHQNASESKGSDQLANRSSKSQNLSNSRQAAVDKEKSVSPGNRWEEIIEKSDVMESLRVNTPTPPTNQMPDDIPSRNPSPSSTILSDDVPSTSRAALEVLQRSQNMPKGLLHDASSTDVVFKKPLAPAPRAKSKKCKSEVDRLKLAKIPVQEEELSTTGIRRSKRGQVPLQMSWCHTMDPNQFGFMRAQIPNKTNLKAKKGNPSKTKKASDTKPKSTVQKTLPNNRGPLCSSTPRISEKLPVAKPHSETLGVSTLTWEETALPPEPEKVPKKRGRSKKGVVVVQTDTEPEPESEPEPMVSPVRPLRSDQEKPDVSCKQAPSAGVAPDPVVFSTPLRDEQEEASSQLMHWLRGVGEAPPSASMSDENASVSPANELIFCQVDGIDYAFYNTKEKAMLGYMRFKPYQKRKMKLAKVHPLKLLVQFGEFNVQTVAMGDEEEVQAGLRVGDMIEIDTGTRYSIQNAIDKVSVLMCIRT
ncbi:uncharacterized protein LOC6536230 isoform X1 [Drosophila yakuba]|uniref:Uncharacterized protein n=1 Tax=Drosophila yakuba TaxID=7245 RepID=B4PT72_DROYA|nr:uncharacterized protein LOC6536230 isoform X1 [Drosophila yakuba]EDW96533.1 uncharacterized protein Dyak_GE25885 [Drosophila yakuba]